MKENLSSKIKEIDKLIDIYSDELTRCSHSISDLKKQRAKLVKLQECDAYKKWDIKENNCYVRFTNESRGILFQGIRILNDDQTNKKCTIISYLYRVYDEYSLHVEQDQITYSHFDEMLRTSDVYPVTETILVSLLAKILELPDVTKINELKLNLEKMLLKNPV